ncbi:MAG TPA: DUF4097 family beta strand repeat-containing protein [Micromonospora sp.]|nr:DUF4097 family beta strand repeat-containing protein [Micromonospora sp.]
MNASRTASAAVSLLTFVALAGCVRISPHQLVFDKTEDVKITEIAVTPGSGDVTVRTAAVSMVQIKRTVRYRGDEPDANYRIEGTVLTVDTRCGRNCSVSYDITAPQGVAVGGSTGSGDLTLTNVGRVDVATGSGSITVQGASQAVRAETGSGDITVTDGLGPVSVEAKSGSVVGRGLGGGEVSVRTNSGDVSLTLDTPQSVRLSVGSGDVTLSVPTGSYRVSARTSSGDQDIRVPSDPAAPFLLDLSSRSGDIELSYRL